MLSLNLVHDRGHPVFIVFLSTSRSMPEQHLKLGHVHILPYSFKFITEYHSITRCFTVSATKLTDVVVFIRCPVHFTARTAAILTLVLMAFFQSPPPANARTVLQLGHDCFLQIHHSSIILSFSVTESRAVVLRVGSARPGKEIWEINFFFLLQVGRKTLLY
jgi:hypothetical protein